jgi:hypothetical protein
MPTSEWAEIEGDQVGFEEIEALILAGSGTIALSRDGDLGSYSRWFETLAWNLAGFMADESPGSHRHEELSIERSSAARRGGLPPGACTRRRSEIFERPSVKATEYGRRVFVEQLANNRTSVP